MLVPTWVSVPPGACAFDAPPSWYTQSNTGPISITAQAPPEKLDGCVKAIMAELPKIGRDDYLSDEEIHNAAFAAEMGQTLEREKSSELAHSLTFWWTSAGLPYYLGYVDNVRKATRADIARYLDTYVLGKPFVFGVMVSPEMASGMHLDQAHFDALVGAKTWVAPSPVVMTENAK